LLTEHTLEIRFKANPAMIDHRGSWAAIIAREMGLSAWNIKENRIDFSMPDKSQHAFISYRNFGITIKDQQTPNFFADKANKLIRLVMGLREFKKPLPVERIGIRAKICQPYDGEFSIVSNHLRDVFFKSETLDALGSEESVTDVAAILYFSTKLGQINSVISANDAEQLKRIFQHHEDFPEASWTADMDYFSKTPELMSEKNISKTVSSFVGELDERYAAISGLINLN